ncbi:MAG: type VI secretion system-associated protein TagF [Pseudomonadota bacterium]
MGGGYGIYGKIPGAGDFIRRGLSPEFISAWDGWMQRFLLTGREALGGRWQDAYFSAPIWRFALSPRIAGAAGVVGIVMPSVDRVGRQFPLCLAAELEAQAWPAYLAASDAFETLESAALDSLDDGGTPESLAAALAPLSAPVAAPVAHPFALGRSVALATPAPLPAGAATATLAPAGSLWISSHEGQHRMMTNADLPSTAEEATAFFDGAAPAWTTGGA